jgi:hypothetical protein
VEHVIKGEDGKFDWILGLGSAKMISNVIDCHFNIDGAKPPCRKVGLIDEHQIWCFLMGLFSYECRITFLIDGNINMI